MSERSQPSRTPGTQGPASSSRRDAHGDLDMSEPISTLDTQVAEFNLKTAEDLVGGFVKRIVNARTTAQLVSLVPAPVQERTKKLLEQIVQAHLKTANASSVLKEWQDALAKNFFDLPELNSIRAPSVQVSKLASENGQLDSKNFNDALVASKRSALERMIEIKEKEISILEQLCDVDAQSKALLAGWRIASGGDHISPEALTILLSHACGESLVKTTVSIGANAAYRQLETKKKKSETVKKVSVKTTGALPGDRKELMELIKEMNKRQRQSSDDKRKASKSGKGPRGAGPSKTKNQKKNTNKVSKGRKGKNGKRGTSSGKQQRKR